MFGFVRLWVGIFVRLFRCRRCLWIENLALRQQLAVFKRQNSRPRLAAADKIARKDESRPTPPRHNDVGVHQVVGGNGSFFHRLEAVWWGDLLVCPWLIPDVFDPRDSSERTGP
jgi:hypothetical protein